VDFMLIVTIASVAIATISGVGAIIEDYDPVLKCRLRMPLAIIAIASLLVAAIVQVGAALPKPPKMDDLALGVFCINPYLLA